MFGRSEEVIDGRDGYLGLVVEEKCVASCEG